MNQQSSNQTLSASSSINKPVPDSLASKSAANKSAAGDNMNEDNNEGVQLDNYVNDLDNEEEAGREVTIDDIRDSIVSASTLQSYVGEMCKFLQWVVNNENNWLTDYGRTQLGNILVQREDETIRVFRTRKTFQLKNLLRHSDTHSIVILDQITPTRYMNYIMSLSGRRTARHLSKSSYGSKRAALFHLFRLHNKLGFSPDFKVELGNLFKGFLPSNCKE